jgi:multicomponent K+:H+ antiporter subunit A
VAGGILWVEARPLIRPQAWIAWGLLVAGGTALSAGWMGLPLLSAYSADLRLPFIGPAHLSSVLFFDIGVYLLVVGATMLMLVALAHQALRFYRRLTEPAAPAVLGED